MRRVLCLSAVVTVAFVAGSAGAGAPQLTIVEHGSFPVPPRGTFESGPPFCASGTWRDTNPREGGTQVTFDRVHTCGDGSGTLVVHATMLNHFKVAAESWTAPGRIAGGTGTYLHLRGLGTISGVRHDATTFTDTWTGAADLDDVAPTAAIGTVRVRALTRPAGAVSLTVPLTARDNVAENAVAWELTVSAGATRLAKRSGSTTTGSASVTLASVRPPKAARSLQLSLAVSDPFENGRTVTKPVRLPRRA